MTWSGFLFLFTFMGVLQIFLVISQKLYLSQNSQIEQKPFCEQGESTNADKRRQISQSIFANVGCVVLCHWLTWCLCAPLWNLFFCVVLWEKETKHLSGVLSLIEHMDRTVAFLRIGRTSREMLNPRPSLCVPYCMRVLFYYSIFRKNLLWVCLVAIPYIKKGGADLPFAIKSRLW